MIKNPMKPGDPVYDMAFNLYAMEESGLLMTHKGCLNHLCELMTSVNLDPYNPEEFAMLCREAGVDWDLDPDDRDYVYKRCGIYPMY